MEKNKEFSLVVTGIISAVLFTVIFGVLFLPSKWEAVCTLSDGTSITVGSLALYQPGKADTFGTNDQTNKVWQRCSDDKTARYVKRECLTPALLKPHYTFETKWRFLIKARRYFLQKSLPNHAKKSYCVIGFFIPKLMYNIDKKIY